MEEVPPCVRCGRPMEQRTARWGSFYGCSGFPECRHLVRVSQPPPADAPPAPKVILEMETEGAFRVHGPAALGYALQAVEDMGIVPQHTASRGDWERGEGRCTAVFPLTRYEEVLETLRLVIGSQSAVEGIPAETLGWFRRPPEPAEETGAASALERLPAALRRALFPFQVEGIRFGLRRRGRILLGDEMGLGKSIQAIGLAFLLDAWPVLVVCPACMRLGWAEEWEKWGPGLRPADLHLVLDSNDKLPQAAPPKVTIVSYRMATILLGDLAPRRWGMVIADESHTLRTTVNAAEAQQTAAVCALVRGARYAALLSGTPSVTRPYDMFHQVDALYPGLLGKDKWAFARAYCEMQCNPYLTVGPCTREWELNLLLTGCLFLRRTKRQVMTQLPAKRRQLVPLALAAAAPDTEVPGSEDAGTDTDDGETASNLGSGGARKQRQYRLTGQAKALPTAHWLRAALEGMAAGTKVVLFAHHLAVLDALQRELERDGCPYFRIDGATPVPCRAHYIRTFHDDPALRVALVGVTASALGIDLSAASVAVFAELPPDVGWLLQAEDRLHRRGQRSAVTVYIMMAHDVPSGSPTGAAAKALAACQAYDSAAWAAMCANLRSVRSVTEGPCSLPPDAPPLATAADAPQAATEADPPPQPPAEERTPVAEWLQGPGGQFLFEVSVYTGRLHIHHNGPASAPGPQLTPSHNLRPEDLGDLPAAAADLRTAAEAFLAEYRRLTPYQQRCLRGAPARPPLSLMLCRSPPKSSSQHPGHRRFTPRTEPEAALPDGGRWLPLPVHYGSPLHRTVTYPLPLDARGQPLCITCAAALSLALRPSVFRFLAAQCGPDTSTGTQTSTSDALRTDTTDPCGPPGMVCSENDMFCSGPCRLQYFIKRNGALLRRQLFQLERGVCRSCGLDCTELCARLQAIGGPEDREAFVLRAAPHFGMEPAALRMLVEAPTEGNAWNADHIVPVHLHGGECGLENLQTLCVVCHRRKSRQEADARLGQRRRRVPDGGLNSPAAKRKDGSTPSDSHSS